MHSRFLAILVIFGASLSMIEDPVIAEESWKIYKLELEDQVFKIPYSITNANLRGIEADPDFTSIVISFSESKKSGTLEIVIPRNLIDARTDGGSGDDDDFIVLVDGEEETSEETNKSPCFRTLLIPVPGGAEEIEIIATSIYGIPTRVLPIYLATDNNAYQEGEVITISGCTNLTLDDKIIDIDIVNPEGKIYRAASIAPKIDGSFLTSTVAKGDRAINGTYAVRATYAGQSVSSSFVVPEFSLSNVLVLIFGISLVMIFSRIRHIFAQS